MPQIGDKFKCRVAKGIFAFVEEGSSKNGVVWWSFYDVKTGKRRFFYPEEVYPADQKVIKPGSTSKSSYKIEWDRNAEPFEISVGGVTLKVV